MANSTNPEPTLQSLLDEREISHQLSRFVRMLDQRRFEDFKDVFADNVAFDYAEGVERHGLQEMQGRVSSFLANCGPTHHLLGSLIIEATGDTAISRAYIQSRHQGSGERDKFYFDSNGEYIDHWERQSAGWRIVKRKAIAMFQQGNPAAFGAAESVSLKAG